MKLKATAVEQYYPIGIIIPTTSRNTHYKTVDDTAFLSVMLPSFLEKYNKHGKHSYNFYVAYDDDDAFFLEHHDALLRRFSDMTPDNFTLKLYTVSNMKSKVGHIWNFLAEKAYDENEYLFQLGDDIRFLNSGWEKLFINVLKKTDNVGVTGPRDDHKPDILTQNFVHKKHLDIFGYFFHPEIINWYIDDWLTHVYEGRSVPSIRIQNASGITPKYNVVDDKKNYLKCLHEGKKILEKRRS